MKRIAFLLVTFAALFPAHAAAQPSDSAVANADTDSLFREGITAFDEQRFEEAWVAFKKAYALNPTLFILHNLAFAAVKAEHYLEAARLLEPVLPCEENCPEELNNFGPSLLVQANEHIGRLRIRTPVSGARLEVDGEAVPSWALTKDWPVEPGVHRVVGYAGDQSDSKEVSVMAGRFTEVELGLASRQGPESNTEKRLSPGDPGELGLASDSAGSERTKAIVLVAGSITTGFALASGVVLSVSSSGLRADARNMKSTLADHDTDCSVSSPECNNLAQTAERAESRKTLANRLFLASGVLAVATGTTWLLWPEKVSPTQSKRQNTPATVGVLPSVGTDHASLVISGSF